MAEPAHRPHILEPHCCARGQRQPLLGADRIDEVHLDQGPAPIRQLHRPPATIPRDTIKTTSKP